MDNTLDFPRQYYLDKVSVSRIYGWRTKKYVNGWYIHHHPEVEVNLIISEYVNIAIVGYFFHPSNIDCGIQYISEKVKNGELSSENDFYSEIKSFCGRFIVLYSNSSVTFARTDALSLRNLYYVLDNGVELIAQDLAIVSNIYGSNLTANSKAADFFNNDFKKTGSDCWVGSETVFRNVFKLLPNMHLNLDNASVSRYWPDKAIVRRDLEAVSKEISRYLGSILKSASLKYELQSAITAGYDSRLVAAICKKNSIEVNYFIDKHSKSKRDDVDFDTACVLSNLLGVTLDVNYVNNLVEPPSCFSEHFSRSSFYSRNDRCKVIFNYYKKYEGRLNICPVGEVGRTRFGRDYIKPNEKFLVYKYGYKNSQYANEQADIWLREALPVCKNVGINVYTLFYWEQDLGNWGSVGNVESDIAIEEFNPFNSHYVHELMVSLDEKHSSYIKNDLFRSILEINWPESNSIPINDTYDFVSFFKRLCRKEPFYTYLDFFRFKFFNN